MLSVVYLDLELLEELGIEFHKQDEERASNQDAVDEASSTTPAAWEPNMDSFTTFLENSFATTSTCGHQSLSIVLAAAATARDAKMQGDGIDTVLTHIVMWCSLWTKLWREGF